MNRKALRVWHKRLGIMSVLLVLWLALSGIVINHSDRFELNKHYVGNTLVNRLYGLKSYPRIPGFMVDGTNFYCVNQSLYRETKAIASCDSFLLDMAVNPELLVLMNGSVFFVMSSGGELYETIGFDLFAREFDALTEVEGDFFVQSSDKQWWQLDLDALELIVVEGKDIRERLDIAAQSDVSVGMLSKASTQALGHSGISVERLLLDAHSGRLFGTAGVVLVDFFAVLFVVLSLTGAVLFFRQKP